MASQVPFCVFFRYFSNEIGRLPGEPLSPAVPLAERRVHAPPKARAAAWQGNPRGPKVGPQLLGFTVTQEELLPAFAHVAGRYKPRRALTAGATEYPWNWIVP